MGMDVHGESGAYFRNNAWWWHPLAEYIEKVAPEMVNQSWHYNDGAGLNAEDSIKLAELLEAELASGRTVEYQIKYEAHLASLPHENCKICGGTGVRSDAVGVEMGQTTKIIPSDPPGHPRAGQIGWCNGCDGVGHKPHFATNYPFSAENVQEFAKFLRECNGFTID